jgi:hypothetical protein
LFGKHFKVEENKTTGELQIVATFNGKEILSTEPEMVGELAQPEEAIAYLIERYPHKDRIMGAGPSGSGAGGGDGDHPTGNDKLDDLRKRHKDAVAANDGRTATLLKRKIHNLQQQINASRA